MISSLVFFSTTNSFSDSFLKYCKLQIKKLISNLPETKEQTDKK